MKQSDEHLVNIHDLAGLAKTQPFFALMIAILMFSMAGIPPLAGFYAKLTVIKAVVDVNLLAVAIVAVIMSVIGAYYYLRMIKVMYFDSPENEFVPVPTAPVRVLFSANCLMASR